MWVFLNILLPIWIILGVIGLIASILYFCTAVSNYKDAKQRRSPDKYIAQKANEVYTGLFAIIACIFLPIAIVPAMLYFPVKWGRSSYFFLKQLSADRKGE